MRDDEGRMIQNGHIVGTLRRICKLLYHRIRTVFVFDGGVPFLKRRIMEKRRQRQAFDEVRRQRAARGLLANQLLIHNEAKRAGDGEDLDPAEKERRASRARFVQADDDNDAAFEDEDSKVVSLIDEDDENVAILSESEDEESKPSLKQKRVQRSAARPSEARSKPKPSDFPAKPSTSTIVFDVEEDKDEDGDAAEEEEEEEEGEYATIHDVDLSTLDALPLDEQHKILVRLRNGTREFRRDELLPVAGDPAKYSATQLQHFLKDAKRKREIYAMQRQLSTKAKRGGGSRIASDFTREYTLVLDPSLKPDKPSEQAKTAAVVTKKPVDAEEDVTRGLSVLQAECVRRLFEGLEGSQSKENCLSMLEKNGFQVQPIVEGYRKEKRENLLVEQLFEGLGGTVDRDTCRGLLASKNWHLEETLLSYVEAESINVIPQEQIEQRQAIDLTESQDKGNALNIEQKAKIVEADISFGADEKKLHFRFKVSDITQDSLALFADIFQK
jgi:hypothetical protein